MRLEIGTRVIQNYTRADNRLHGKIVGYKGYEVYPYDRSRGEQHIYIIQWDELKSHPDEGLRTWPETDIFKELKILDMLPEELFEI